VRVAGSGDVDELGVGVEAEFPCRLRRSRNLGVADGAALAHLGAPDGGEAAAAVAEGMLARVIDDLGGPDRLGSDRALAPQRGQSCPDRRAADTVLLRQLEFAGEGIAEIAGADPGFEVVADGSP